MKYKMTSCIAVVMAVMIVCNSANASRYMESLDRGVVAVKVTSGVYVGWRMFGTDPASIGFNVYRGTTKLNSSPITTSTNYSDASGTTSSTYSIAPVIDGVEQAKTPAVSVWAQNYLTIPLSPPAGGTTPDGVAYTYNANDCSVGDLDGDGQYEIILKWDPSNSKDNSQNGFTGDVYLDAYKLNGTRLWRIDLGKNIRAGAHYTQFMVYDLDGDGKAEVVCKTAPGTIDGLGHNVIMGSDNPNVDYRVYTGGSSYGYVLSGPEYLTVFKGPNGAELTTVNYDPPRGDVSSWGDSYGNRVDRFLACVAYLDGVRPSVVMCRGYYTRAVLVAYDLRGGALIKRWTFDSNTSGNGGYAGQGCHSLSVADVDGDGKDEIVYGACCIDHNGMGLYTTGLGHGDALHVSKMDPDRPGLQVFQAHEGGSGTLLGYGSSLRDAGTGAIILFQSATADVGRACASHVAASPKGYQCWANGWIDCKGNNMTGSKPGSTNFVSWWDGTLTRQLLDGTSISKYGGSTLLSASGCSSNNGTKSTPCLSGDILGDWREEVIFRTSTNNALRIYTTTTPTSYRFYTLMQDPQYRMAIVWQNVAYNQPPHPSFYLGDGMATPPTPDIVYAGADPGPIQPDPMTWSSVPASTGLYSVTMAASAVTAGAFDPEYYFTCTSGGGHDSGWQTSQTYNDAGLTEGMTYTYTVKARDWSNQSKVTSPSVEASVTTVAMPAPIAMTAYWPLSETSGTIVGDVSGNGNNGTLEGAANPDAMWTAGKYANCLSFDGTGGRVNVPSSPTIDFGDESMTISFWLKEPATITAGTRHEILIKGTFGLPGDNGSGKRYEFYRKSDTSGNDYFHWVIDDNLMLSDLQMPSSNFCTGNWVHVVGIRNTVSNQLLLYANGVLIGIGTDLCGSISQDEPLYIGDNAMVGSIDDVRIYRHALSSNEVIALHLGVWNVDTASPLPDPMTFAVLPHAASSADITMTATEAHDESAIEYFFANLTDPNHNSGWQDITTYTDGGLVNNTTYTYQVIARDKSLAQNETAWSDEASATTLRYDCSSPIIADLDGNCQADFLDFAFLASHWNDVLPLTVDTLINGTFDTDITSGWQTFALPSATGYFIGYFDDTTGNPPGSAVVGADTTPDGTDGQWFYQMIPVIAGKQYKLSGEWMGNLSEAAIDPANRNLWSTVLVGFENSADPNTWTSWSNPSAVMYRKAFGSTVQNIGPDGVWGWEQITASPTNGPADGVFNATGSYMVVAFSAGGIPASGVGYYYLDNLSVKTSPCPTIDFNGDCILDIKDIAAFAEQWLTCNRNPAGECWK